MKYTTVLKESIHELEAEILELEKIGFKRHGQPVKKGEFYLQIMHNF